MKVVPNTSWEYVIDEMPKTIEECGIMLTGLGLDGHELCAVIERGGVQYGIFKCPMNWEMDADYPKNRKILEEMGRLEASYSE